MRVLLQVPYPDSGVATPPPRGKPVAATAARPWVRSRVRQRDTQRKVCALSSWHGEHGTDPLALLVHEAMRSQAAAGAGSWPAGRGTVVRLEALMTGRAEEPAAVAPTDEHGRYLG